MSLPALKVAYVVKRYPRFSETFVVNEILAHEAAGRTVEIFSLYPPNDTHFQDALAKVRAPVTYLSAEGLKVSDFWNGLQRCGDLQPGFWTCLADARGSDVREVHQAALLARLLLDRGLRHIHAHFATTATEVARLASRFAQIPYTFTAHAKDIFHESVDPDDLRRKLRQAAGTVTVSDFNVRHLRSRFGSDAVHVRRIYNGLDLDRFPFRSPADRPPHVVAVGRLVEKKGFDVLIDACRLLSRTRTFTCDIVGTGDQEAKLAQLIVRHRLQRVVRLVGALPQSAVVERVASASALAAPCVVGGDGNADGMPTVLLESMALGTPCVATDVTGIPELIRSEDTGILVPQKNPAALAEALERLFVDAELRVRLAIEARRCIETDFDARRNASKQWQLFEASARWTAPVSRTAIPGASVHAAVTA
ncbi:MAG: glycosyltransferase [Verrucomicrobiales bacterium]|nr:glycosyltransferase [Verrucomicrobiales bacterium]